MLVYRICRRQFAALDGEGARRFGGRWNEPGAPVVYTSSSAALAALELLVHITPAEAPEDLVLLTIEIPDNAAGARLDRGRLPGDWASAPGDSRLRALGMDWLERGETLYLQVPSSPVPEELNVLLNPAHRDFGRVRVVAQRAFTFDPRLR
ncbi:MAG TPA: RES domain-containing protein [Gemmatimonadales bacterium]|nr:RES domain-containing protein [Gemmatimonadales bacterium]